MVTANQQGNKNGYRPAAVILRSFDDHTFRALDQNEVATERLLLEVSLATRDLLQQIVEQLAARS